jgi:hypothetical protein
MTVANMINKLKTMIADGDISPDMEVMVRIYARSQIGDEDTVSIPQIYTILVPMADRNAKKYWWEETEWHWPEDPPDNIENYRNVVVIA